MQELTKIHMGSLLHDIGKFFQRTGVKLPEGYKERYCPQGMFVHAAYTGYFFDKYKEYFPKFIGNSFEEIKDLSAKHHSANKSDMEKIITKADTYSSKIDRYKRQDEGKQDNSYENQFQKKRLDSIFDYITFKEEGSSIKCEYEYDLDSFNYSKSAFPERKKIGDLTKKYQHLWDEFIKEFLDIKTIVSEEMYTLQLYSILRKYTAYICSDTRVEQFNQISLFDHSRVTTAIAGSEYFGQKHGEKFLLVQGDISGIQNYIFSILNTEDTKNISKRLRGRSYIIQLLSKQIAYYIASEFGLTVLQTLYVASGKFQLLLTTKKGDVLIENIDKKINEILYKEFDGKLECRLASVGINDTELRDNYIEKSAELNVLLSKRKYRPYIYSFDCLNIDPTEVEKHFDICGKCGARIHSNSETCHRCNQQIELGEKLVSYNKLFVYAMQEFERPEEFKNYQEIDFGELGKVYVVTQWDSNSALSWCKGRVHSIELVNPDGETSEKNISIKNVISLYDEVGRTQSGVDKILSFEDLAKKAEGVHKLAALKMDVDNLGLIFQMGFPSELQSISSVATLSRQLDNFFTQTLMEISRNEPQFQDAFYTVFSGGDDVFIIGAWDKVILLAFKIEEKFREYTQNSHFTLSAGIEIFRPKYPLSKLSEHVEEYLERSKGRGKNRVSLFDETLTWKQARELMAVSNDIFKALEEGKISRTLIYGLYKVYLRFFDTLSDFEKEGADKNWIPQILYKITRNVKDEQFREVLITKLMRENHFYHYRFVANYILNRTRGGKDE